MRDAYIPVDSLVLIELDTSIYNPTARTQIAEYIRTKFKAQAMIVGEHGHPTTINVMMPVESQQGAKHEAGNQHAVR